MSTDQIFVLTSNSREHLRRVSTHRRRSIIRDFALTTSAHGIPGIARSRTAPNRCFWSICFVAFSSITLYFVTREIRAYFSYSTQTSVDMTSEWPQHFPAFTFCNLAPVRYDRFLQPFLNYTTSLNISDLNDSNSFSAAHVKHLFDFFQMKINRNESLDEFFFPLQSMLIRCTFNGVPCTAANFTSFALPSYGFCYTFNGKMKNSSNVFFSDQFGGSGNLNLRLYVHSHQYVPYIREGIGMIGMVHDNRQIPMIDYSGMALGVGFKHRITYTKKIITYLRSPYSTCDDQIPLMMKAMFDNYENADFNYSEDICYELCTQVFMFVTKEKRIDRNLAERFLPFSYERCGCINPLQWNARSIVLPETDQIIVANLCNISDPCYSREAAVLLTSNDLMSEFCSYCHEQCSITTFNLQSSVWKAPASWLLNDIKRFVENTTIPLPNDWSTQWRSHIESSYLSVELIHESSIVENYTQKATLSPVDVLSNVGGQTGLWIGVSFLSLMEFAEMLYCLIQNQWRLFQMKRNDPSLKSSHF